jgi:hypothetical protein
VVHADPAAEQLPECLAEAGAEPEAGQYSASPSRVVVGIHFAPRRELACSTAAAWVKWTT